MGFEDHKEFRREVYRKDVNVKDRPSGWIQWKGTDVCVDLHCMCGNMEHFDGYFFYFYECSECKRVYAVGENILLIELNEEQKKYVEDETCSGIKTCWDSE